MKNNKGFSLVELIVVIAIMAILAAVAVVGVSIYIPKAQRASDDQLIADINYIFKTACLDAGVELSDVTAATWNKDTWSLTEVKVNGVANADLLNSFNELYSVKNPELKYYGYVRFENGAFVGKGRVGEAGDNAGANNPYGDLKFEQSDIDAIKGSNFNKLEADVLLGRVDLATNLLTDLANGDSTKVHNMLWSNPNLDMLARYLDCTDHEDPNFESRFEALTIQKAEMMLKDNPGKTVDELVPLAANEILSNTAVLVAATEPQYEQDVFVSSIANGSAKNEILGNLESDPSTAISQAALVYGMYTSYAAANNLPVSDDFNIQVVLDALEKDSDFCKYMADSTKSGNDLTAYNASMNMINTSAQDESAVKDILLNGFDNDNLSNTMKDALSD